MSHVDQGPLPAYNSLTDNNLSGYFSSTRMRSQLRKSGLITKRGEIVSENTYRLNMSRKEHKKHVKDMLAQAIVHKTLDLERARQAEIRRKLEEIAKIELVRRVRSERHRNTDETLLPYLSPKSPKTRTRKSGKSTTIAPQQTTVRHSSGAPFKKAPHDPKRNASVVSERASRDRKRENYVLPLVSPRRGSCQSSMTSASTSRPRRRPVRSASSPTRKGKRPISALSSNYDDENETVIYLDDEGRPISPAHVDRSELKYASKDPIDTRHLYSLDTAALRKYAVLMAKMEQGRGGLNSPYLIPQVPLPPKSPRTGRGPQSAHRHRSDSDFAKSVSPKRPATASQAYLHPSGSPKHVRGQLETMCEVFMEYHGSSLSLVREQFDKRQDVIVEQQHCGGNTLTVFRDKMEAGTKFSFISYRHRGYPFSLSIYIDGKMDCRVSVCCENRHSKGGRIGGKNGHFSICSISGAVPCYKCQVEKGIRVKSAAPRRKLKRPPQLEEVTVVETQIDQEEAEERSEAVQERSEEILVPVDDDEDKKSNTGQTKSEADNYDDDFDSSSESEKEDFLNFQPKDARGVDKTTGKVDINDSTDEEEEEEEDDNRARTPTPHGRRKKKMKKKKGQGRHRSSSSSSSSSGSSSDTAREENDEDDKKKKKNEDKEDSDKKMVLLLPEVVVEKLENKCCEEEAEEAILMEEQQLKEEEEKEETILLAEEKKVSVSSSSSSSSSPSSSEKEDGSSDDYSDSKKEEKRKYSASKSEHETKEVDMGADDDKQDGPEPVAQATVSEVGAAGVNTLENGKSLYQTGDDSELTKEASMEHEATLEKRKHNLIEEKQSDNCDMGDEEKLLSCDQESAEAQDKEVERLALAMPPSSLETSALSKDGDKEASVASSTSSSPSPSSSSGSATIHDKGPNTTNDPTMTLDDSWRQDNPLPEKEEEPVKEEERVKEIPRVEIIREDLNEKTETKSDTDASSSSSSSDESDSDDGKKGKKSGNTTVWQAEVHQNESQPESDPEATHGGNDPDNVANGSNESVKQSFETAVPVKAQPGSVMPLLEASQKNLVIKGVTLNKSQVYEVAEFLEKKGGLNSINLVNCAIDDNDVQKLMEAVRKSPSNPMMLNLGLNPLTAESVPHILTTCKVKPSIEAVILQGTRLGDDGVNAMTVGMMSQLEDKKMRGEPVDQCIHELDLSDCKFGDQGALAVARLLTSAVDIDTLTLTHNHAISSDGWKVIGDALKLNNKLETVTLDHNYIGDEGISYITSGLYENRSITALDINDVGLTDKGGKHILELLKRNTFLLEITVMDNRISESMSENIQKYISLNKATFSRQKVNSSL